MAFRVSIILFLALGDVVFISAYSIPTVTVHGQALYKQANSFCGQQSAFLQYHHHKVVVGTNSHEGSLHCTGRVPLLSLRSAMIGGNQPDPTNGGEDSAWSDNLPSSGTDAHSVSKEGLRSVCDVWIGTDDAEGQIQGTIAVSRVLLSWMYMQRRFAAAVKKENYEEAAILKRKMNKAFDKQMQMLEGKIQSAVDTMRQEAKKKRKNALQSVELDLEEAIAEEDYPRAQKLKVQRDALLKRRVYGVTPAKLMKKIDSVWVEGEINNKIAQLKAKEERMLEDPVLKYKHMLAMSLQNEDYAGASHARDCLRKVEYQRDLGRMERYLARELAARIFQLSKLRQNPELHLIQILNDAVEGEDYETAQEIKESLSELRKESLIEQLYNRTAEAHRANCIFYPLATLEEQLDKCVSEEDYDRAGKVWDLIVDLDATKRLEKELDVAVREERFGDARTIKESLLHAYTQAISPAMLRQLGHSGVSPKFTIGTVVQHSSNRYRGVVVGYHDRCQASEDWIRSANVYKLPHGRDQRFYHVLPDTRELSMGKLSDSGLPAFMCGMNIKDQYPTVRTTYVSEDELKLWQYQPQQSSGFLATVLRSVIPESPISNPLVSSLFFSYRRGQYLHDGKALKVIFYHMPPPDV